MTDVRKTVSELWTNLALEDSPDLDRLIKVGERIAESLEALAEGPERGELSVPAQMEFVRQGRRQARRDFAVVLRTYMDHQHVERILHEYDMRVQVGEAPPPLPHDDLRTFRVPMMPPENQWVITGTVGAMVTPYPLAPALAAPEPTERIVQDALNAIRVAEQGAPNPINPPNLVATLQRQAQARRREEARVERVGELATPATQIWTPRTGATAAPHQPAEDGPPEDAVDDQDGRLPF